MLGEEISTKVPIHLYTAVQIWLSWQSSIRVHHWVIPFKFFTKVYQFKTNRVNQGNSVIYTASGKALPFSTALQTCAMIMGKVTLNSGVATIRPCRPGPTSWTRRWHFQKSQKCNNNRRAYKHYNAENWNVGYVPILCIVMLYLLHSIACKTIRVAPLHDDTTS